MLNTTNMKKKKFNFDFRVKSKSHHLLKTEDAFVRVKSHCDVRVANDEFKSCFTNKVAAEAALDKETTAAKMSKEGDLARKAMVEYSAAKAMAKAKAEVGSTLGRNNLQSQLNDKRQH